MKVINFGIDWLTLTNTLSSRGHPQALIEHFARLSGVTCKWSNMGYKGHQDKDKGLRYGSRSRKDGAVDEMLVMSGGGSDAMADGFRGMLAYCATRIDIQITVQLDKPDSHLADREYERIVSEKEQGASSTGRRKASSVRSDSGSTLYVGTRKSGRKFLRFYDKSSGYECPLGLIWRQEVQYGRYLAQAAMELYEEIRGDEAAIIDLVSAEFYECAGFSLYKQLKQASGVQAAKVAKNTTLEAKLAWLETCVKPTIAALLEHDLEDRTLKALGLATAARYRSLDD